MDTIKKHPESKLVYLGLLLFFMLTSMFLWNSFLPDSGPAIALEKFISSKCFDGIDKECLEAHMTEKESKVFKFFSTARNFIGRPYHIPYVSQQKKSASHVMLCNLGGLKFCSTVEPSDVIDDFWVIGPLYSYNQSRIHVLYQLHENFKNYVKSIGMRFCTIEGILKDSDQIYLGTHPGSEPEEIQIYIYDRDYIRENLLNVAIRKLPKWEYVAWIDAHQTFQNPYWWEETIIMAEKKASVQIFHTSARLDKQNITRYVTTGVTYYSFLTWDISALPYFPEIGNAFAIRRELYLQIGTIMDTCVSSGCDMLYVLGSFPPWYKFDIMYRGNQFEHEFDAWIEHTRTIFKTSRVAIRGEIIHFAHEHLVDYYTLLPMALSAAGFSPTRDLERDENFTLRIINPKMKAVTESLAFDPAYD